MKKVALYLLLCLAAMTTQIRAQGAPPQLPPDVRALVESEQAFSRASAERGMRAAFLAYLADDGIIFRPAPLNGKKFWETNTGASGLLTWRPAYAHVSQSGDLGYTTGPYEFSAKTSQDAPADYGNYVTIWRRQKSGAWKVAIDLGTSNPAPTEGAAVVDFPSVPKTAPSNSKTAARELGQTERQFAAEAAERGAGPAYSSHLAASPRILRPQMFPLVKPEEVRAFVSALPPSLTWSPSVVVVSRAGDLGYTYGTYEVRQGEKGSYVRLWRKESPQGWRIVLDIFNPTRPAKTP
jgi:ketosteroid isomerase-like protein